MPAATEQVHAQRLPMAPSNTACLAMTKPHSAAQVRGNDVGARPAHANLLLSAQLLAAAHRLWPRSRLPV